MTVTIRNSIGVLLLLLLVGCAAVKPKPPEVSLQRLQVGELNLSHASLLADLKIYNPNLIDLTLEEVEYNLKLNGIQVSSGRSTEPVSIASHGYGTLRVNLSAAYFDLLRFVNSAKKQKSFKYSIQGNIAVGGLGLVRVDFPLEAFGTIDIEH